MTLAETTVERDGGVRGPSTPSISLPKGGGAIRGMGEKFAANPVTGTGSMSVPIPVSPGCSGFGPQLSLSYDSCAGNGPFGFGWSLSLRHKAYAPTLVPTGYRAWRTVNPSWQ
jgi:Salmonella virulence plasmid 65kDa B protein